jgi:hypothetical protein
MDTAIVIASISSLASLVVAGGTAVWSGQQNRKNGERQQELVRQQAAAQADLERLKDENAHRVRHEERALTAKAQLDKYREPLLNAANELGDRIDNIRNQGFLMYTRSAGHRGETAILSTLFRFAHYFARLEMLYTDMSAMRFERDEDTKAVAGLIAAVGQTLSSDSFPSFMIWRDEQRAIGELMCHETSDKRKACLGYSEFVREYDGRFKDWLGGIADDLRAPDAARNPRLKVLQDLLAQLVMKLDDGSVLTRVDVNQTFAAPAWLTR